MIPVNRTDLERIDRTAKTLLEDPGVKVEHDEIVDLLLKKGAKPGAKTQEVRFPEEMVEEYVALAPSTVCFADRSGGVVEVTPDSESRFWTGAALFYLPGRGDKGGLRPVHQSDLADFTRIVNGLANVDTVVGTSIEDVPPRHRDFVGFRTMARNTRKHIRTLSFTPKGGEVLIEMARALSEGPSLKERPLFSIGFTAHGPLRWTNLALGVIRKAGIAGSFLATDHTLAHFRSELFEPSLLVREQRGSADERSDREANRLRDRAEQRVASLLKTQAEPVLDEKTEAELLRIEKIYSS